MSHEYRLVVERPEHQDGRRRFTYKKHTRADAERALEAHEAHAENMYAQVGLSVWPAWIETRDCTDWRRLNDEPVEAVPI